MAEKEEWTREQLQDMQIYSLKSALKDACKFIGNAEIAEIFMSISNRTLEDYRND